MNELLKGRIFAVGDIHGCVRELEQLLIALDLRPVDRIVFLGDMVNRGPDSAGVLARIRRLGNARCLLGNHEKRLLEFHRTGNASLLKPYDEPTVSRFRAADWEMLDNMEKCLFLPEFQVLLVHGGILPWLPWEQQGANLLCNVSWVDPKTRKWGKRGEVPQGVSWQDEYRGQPFVICGHTPRLEVYRAPASLCIDTACVYGGKLTACDVATRQLIQVPAAENYAARTPPY